MKRIFKILFIFVLLFFAGTGVYAIIDNVKSSELFTISSIEVKGVINSDRKNLTELSKKLIGHSIFDKNIESILVTDDPWVQKLTAHRVLPNSINVVVFEEKALFNFKDNNKCYIYVASGKELRTSCDNVNITKTGKLDSEKAKIFITIYENNKFLQDSEIELRDYSFVAKLNNETIICPYNEELFNENYKIFVTKLRERYNSIEYVDLTINERIFIKGDKNGTIKG